MSISLSVILDGSDEQFRSNAIPYNDGVIASVSPADHSGWCIQSVNPATLRRLAAVLTQAADKADKLRLADAASAA